MDKIHKTQLKEIILEQEKALKETNLGTLRSQLAKIEQYVPLPHTIIITGVRRSGKSTFLAQIINKFYPEGVYYLNFEDERLLNFDVDDFNLLYETFVELYGARNIFFFDEIQNVPRWEAFVRRMQDNGYKFFITGSNASLLSLELATKLTGRSLSLELLPFSFGEFLEFKKSVIEKNILHDTKSRGMLKKDFNEYLIKGGIPLYLQYNNIEILKSIYEDILYKDVITRYDIKEVKALRELALILFSTISNLFSYNKLKNLLHLGSVNTIKNYVDYLEKSYLIFTINLFSFSIKQQTIANKKHYCIDNGLVESVAFQFSKNSGAYLENIVFLELKRRGHEIYYYKTQDNEEVDFLLRQGKEIVGLIQVTEQINNQTTKNREVKSLIKAMQETKLNSSLILTLDHTEKIKIDGKTITILPVYQWLLNLNL